MSSKVTPYLISASRAPSTSFLTMGSLKRLASTTSRRPTPLGIPWNSAMGEAGGERRGGGVKKQKRGGALRGFLPHKIKFFFWGSQINGRAPPYRERNA